MSIQSDRELEKLRAIGRIVAEALRAMAGMVRPGVTTAEVDEAGEKVLAGHGAVSAPKKTYRFPGAACISVNDEAIHGIPGPRVIREGDLVKLDVAAGKDGFFADAAITVAVPPVSAAARALTSCAERAFRKALDVARPGVRICEIGRAVEQETKRCGFEVMREFVGHGIGRAIHEPPNVPNYYEPRARQRLTEGLVITIEPIVAAGWGRGLLQEDGWTFKTADGRLAAHYEHTVVITRGEPIVLTV